MPAGCALGRRGSPCPSRCSALAKPPRIRLVATDRALCGHGRRPGRNSPGMARPPRRPRALPVLAVTAACLASPGPVLGLLVIGLLNRPEPALARAALRPFDPGALAGLDAPRAAGGDTHLLARLSEPFPPDVLESAALDGAGPGGAGCGTSSCRCALGDCRGMAGGPGRGLGRSGRQHSRAAPRRDDDRHAPVRPVALRRRGPERRESLGPAGTVYPGGRHGQVVVDPLGGGPKIGLWYN